MTDRQSVMSYLGALGAVISSMTLADVGVLIGILTALATFYSNWWHKRRAAKLADERHRLDMELRQAQLNALRDGNRRLHIEPVDIDRRHHDGDEE